MKLIYSLNTEPKQMGLENVMDRQILVYRKAMQIASRFYPITLWTDDRGAKELGLYANEIRILKKNTPNYLWCEPKYEAMLEEDASDSIFIDGDVFLSNKLHFGEPKDVWYEHFEERTFEYGYKPQVDTFHNSGDVSKVFKEWNPDLKGAMNVGILKFGTNEIKDKFRETFYQMKEYYFDVAKMNRVMFKPSIPEMIMEEYALRCLAEYYDWDTDELQMHNDYIHMYGFNKYRAGFLQLVL